MSGERIETAGDLDALPLGSVVVDRHGDSWTRDSSDWWTSPETAAVSPGTLTRKWSPLTVVYRPDRDLIAEAETRGAREALLSAAEALDTAQVWWGDYRDSDGHQRYGACLHEVIDPDSRPYPTTRFVGLTDWLRARAEQIGDDRG